MVLNIYKPKGWTSFDVVAKLRSLLKTKKIGHAGTLDPLAEGVLVVLTGQDTKKQNEYMKMDKEYRAKIALGIESDTYDLEGPVRIVARPADADKLLKRIEGLLPKYIGEITQKVPPYSAVKIKGERLYKQARAGKITEEDVPEKKVKICSIDIESFKEEEISLSSRKLEFPVLTCTIDCGSGTYIRSFAHDLGKDLGTGGALIDLKRTRVGDFKIEDSQKIEDLKL
jgi:tRNA pseudouridine55 synthase